MKKSFKRRLAELKVNQRRRTRIADEKEQRKILLAKNKAEKETKRRIAKDKIKEESSKLREAKSIEREAKTAKQKEQARKAINAISKGMKAIDKWAKK